MGQRFRILYNIEAEQVIVVVVAPGIRRVGDKKDVYELARNGHFYLKCDGLVKLRGATVMIL